LTYAQVLAYIYISVIFSFVAPLNTGLTERSRYNRFCIERSPTWVFGGILGLGAKIFGGMQ